MKRKSVQQRTITRFLCLTTLQHPHRPRSNHNKNQRKPFLCHNCHDSTPCHACCAVGCVMYDQSHPGQASNHPMHSKATAAFLGSNAFPVGGHVTTSTTVKDTQLRKQRPGRWCTPSVPSVICSSSCSHRVGLGGGLFASIVAGKSSDAI